MIRPSAQPFVALALLASSLLATVFLAPNLGPGWVLWFYAASFLPYAFAVHRPTSPATILAVGVAIRLAAAVAEPLLSDDIFRYVWEGRVTLAGFNPFASAPEAPELAALRDEAIWPNVNHPEVSTIYPPVSQYFFALVAVVGGGTTVLRLGLVAAEIATAVAVWRLARPSLDARHAALYLLNPLVVLEVAWSGHLDVLAWGPLVVALLLFREETWRRSLAGGLLLGVSIAAKFLGVVVLPFLLLRLGFRGAWRQRLAALGATVLVVGTSYVGFADAGEDLVRGFGAYAASWRNNDGVFRALDGLSRATLGDEGDLFELAALNEPAMELGFTKEWRGESLPNTTFSGGQVAGFVAKGLAAVLVGLALLWCVATVRDPVTATLVILGTLYFCAPTVHPWYVAWLVPLGVLTHWWRFAVVFSAACIIGYVSWWSLAAGGGWEIPWWMAAVEYGLVFAVLLREVGRPAPR